MLRCCLSARQVAGLQRHGTLSRVRAVDTVSWHLLYQNAVTVAVQHFYDWGILLVEMLPALH